MRYPLLPRANGFCFSLGAGGWPPNLPDACALPGKKTHGSPEKSEPRCAQFNLSLTESELARIRRRAEARSACAPSTLGGR